MIDVACIGIFVADVIASPVNRMPESGKLNRIEQVELFSGGCAMSASIDLRKLGAEVAALGMVGTDGFGEFLVEELMKNGVDASGVRRSVDAPTSASVVLVDGAGERSFLHAIGANGVYTEADVAYDVLRDASIIFIGGALVMPSFDGEGCAAVLRWAKEQGKTTVLDTAWDDTGRWMEALRPCLSDVDYFIPSIAEAEMLSGRNTPEEAAEVFFDCGVGSVVIKLGGEGCFLKKSRDAEGVCFPACAGVKAVDATGAGDAFCSGFLYGLAKGLSAEACCRLANAVGAQCVMAIGATTGIKSFEEVKKLIHREG